MNKHKKLHKQKTATFDEEQQEELGFERRVALMTMFSEEYYYDVVYKIHETEHPEEFQGEKIISDKEFWKQKNKEIKANDDAFKRQLLKDQEKRSAERN